MVTDKLRERGISDDRILVYRFDSLENEELKTDKRLYREVQGKLAGDGKTYLFFDEIQEVKGWEKAVNSLMSDFDVDIYVTGSNSHMMSSEISTYLTGRYISFRIFPLSFEEYLIFRKEYATPKISFPLSFPMEFTKEDPHQHLHIVRFFFDNIGRTFSAAAISKYLKSEHRAIDNETVMNYLAKLESAYILHRCPRYDIQGKEILKTQEKFFVCDTAMRYSVLDYTPDSVAAMLENMVYLELRRRGYDVYIGELPDGKIDFVATRQENKLYIQIAPQIDSEKTENREYGRLLSVRDNYPKYVLRTDEFAGGNYEGIRSMHVADFLLSKEY
jgi:predicted AAA+ superfamily ATPase